MPSTTAVAVGEAVSGWRAIAAGFGIGRTELERMRSAFDHQDLERALLLA
jgi:hypothetical protein